MFLPVFRFRPVQFLIAVPDLDILSKYRCLSLIDIQRCEDRGRVYAGEHSQLPSVIDDGTVMVIFPHEPHISARLHAVCAVLLLPPKGEKVQLDGSGRNLCLGSLLRHRTHGIAYYILYRHVLPVKLSVELVFHESVKAVLQDFRHLLHRPVPSCDDGRLAVLVLSEGMDAYIGRLAVPDIL